MRLLLATSQGTFIEDVSEEKAKKMKHDKIYLVKEDWWRKKVKIIVSKEKNPTSKAKIQFSKKGIP